MAMAPLGACGRLVVFCDDLGNSALMGAAAFEEGTALLFWIDQPVVAVIRILAEVESHC